MFQAKCDLVGMGQLMFSKNVEDDKKRTGETHDAYDTRTWKQKVHVMPDGKSVEFNRFALSNALVAAAKWRAEGIPGEGKKTYTQRIKAGLMVTDRLALTKPDGKPILLDKDVCPTRLFVPSDGKPGSARRVWRTFPVVEPWQTKAVLHIFDEKISEEVLYNHLVTAGQFVGFGAMRVGNGGVNGRFRIENFEWSRLAQ